MRMELGSGDGSSAWDITVLPDRTIARQLRVVNNSLKNLFMICPPAFNKISITAESKFWHYNMFTIYLMKIRI
ncbi:hypothetical protein LBYZC6_36760 [Lacrimispora brassicae]